MKMKETEMIHRLIQYAFRESGDLNAPTLRLLLGMTLEELDNLKTNGERVKKS
jgi:hypothetical protein